MAKQKGVTQQASPNAVGHCENCKEETHILTDTEVGKLCPKCFTQYKIAKNEALGKKVRQKKADTPQAPQTATQEIKDYIAKCNRYLSTYGMFIKKIKLEYIQTRETIIDLPEK